MRQRTTLTRLVAALAAAIVITAVVTLEVSGARGGTTDSPGQAPAPDGPPLPAPAAGGEPSGSLATPPISTSKTSVTQETGAVRWDATLAMSLPVSATHGPSVLTATTASGFTRTRDGAALAAAHLLARTSPRVGPEIFTPTLDLQVRGPNRPALAEAVRAAYASEADGRALADGAPLPGADAELVGFRVTRFADTDCVIEVVLSSTALRVDAHLVATRVSLQWADDDWQLLAPPRGDWAVVSTVLPSSETSDVLDYAGTS